MSKIDTAKQEILTGSSKLYSQNEFNRTDYMIENMVSNRAYLSLSRNFKNKTDLLKKLKKDYSTYRKNWVNILDSYQIDENFSEGKKISPPLSVDIETAAICDLACPHCSRE